MGNTRALLLYRFIQLLSLPAIVFYFFARLLVSRSYWSHFPERLGFLSDSFSRTKPGCVWLHAVSVGEVASAVPLLRQLRAAQPRVPLYLSVSTIAGRHAAVRQTQTLVDGILYSPIDYASCVRRTLRTLRPALVVVLETEIWPNLYNEVKRSGARLAILNGRISNRTWPQYQAWRWFFCHVLQLPDLVLVQSAADYQRYSYLGVPTQRLSVAGNLKYDAAIAPPPVNFPTFDAEQIWIAASTVGPNERGSISRHFVDEDDIVIGAFQELSRKFPKLLLVLAPRQPARFPAVARKLASAGVSFLRRSALQAAAHAIETSPTLSLPGIILLDSIGELAGLYQLAHAVFVGGSLAPRGGHNIIEPAAAGAPVIVGPHMQNFEAITADFLDARAIVQIASPEDLAPAVCALLNDPKQAAELGRRALQLVHRQTGVSRDMADRLWPLYYSAFLGTPRSFLSRALLLPLAFMWKHGGIFKRNRSEQRAASLVPLPVPVVSIGGITVGGAGKTPFANYLAGCLKKRGFSPAIVTRGYRRRYPAESLVFPPGARVSPFFTGDEAQIFLRAAIAPIGIGTKRYETAQILLRQFPETSVILLDDGFQHARLQRDFDIVMIDGLDPFGQQDLVPLGRLREPLAALQRANVFVVTRAENDLRYQAIQTRLRECNADAPVFRTRLLARSWRDYRSGAEIPRLAGRRVGAFCGLGNPESFWETLQSLDIQVVFRWAFDDHHSYKPVELSRIAHRARQMGAELLVTTEKDRINCPENLESVLHPLDLAWLEIEFELDDEPAFIRTLQQAIKLA